MQLLHVFFLGKLVLANAVSFTLQPGETWQAAEGMLKEVGRLLSGGADKSTKSANEGGVAHKTADHSKTPWSWYDLDMDFMKAIEGMPPGRALDLGSGAGTQSIALAKLGWEVVGVDHTADAVKFAEDEAKAAGVTGVKFVQGDLMMPADFLALPELGRGSFDLIIDRGCLHAIQGLDTSLVPELYFFYVKYLLKPKGLHVLKVTHHSVGASVAAKILKQIKIMGYHKSQDTMMTLMPMMGFWLLPSLAFNPIRPFFLKPEELEALVTKHLVDVTVDPDTLIQTVMNNTGMGKPLGMELPIETVFTVARNPEGPVHFKAEPAAGPEAGLRHMNEFATPKQLMMLKKIRESMPPPGMMPGGPGGMPGKMAGKKQEL